MINIGNSLPGLKKNPDLITHTIKVEGKAIPTTIHLRSIAVRKEVNRIPTADIVLIDGDPSLQDFEISSKDLFIPGREIEILLGYHSDEQTVFKGVVVQQSLRIRANNSRLYIQCKDTAYQTTINKKNRVFEEVKDSDAIETILNDYRLKKDIDTTKVKHQDLVQVNATDWDFILSRADANAMICLVEDGNLKIGKPTLRAAFTTKFTYGQDILEFDGELNGLNQYDGVTAKSWDFAEQEIIDVDGKEPSYKGTGNLSGKKISDQLQQPTYDLYHGGNIKSEELQAWADAKLLHSRLSQVLGRLKVQGTSEVQAGQMIELAGVGERFNGKVFVSGVLHQVADGNWTTNIQFGMSEKWFADCYNISATPSAGLLPAMQGLQNGVVTQVGEDPAGEYRIKVKFPIIDPTGEGVWCRLACLDAGNTRGTFFRPELTDEVIVGFINNDPREAVVLGMLHSSNKPSPEPLTNDNHKKGYHSRELLKMEFDDELKIISFETPSGNKVRLDEEAKGIFLEDQHGNKLIMDSEGITLESAKNLTLKTSTGDAILEAMNITASAQVALKTEGSASAEISSGGTLTAKGALVQIN